MPTRIRSHAKINLGLAIGPPRPDGFHSLATCYQTLALHDHLTVAAQRAPQTRIHLRTNDPRVPQDGRNTVWKILERALHRLHLQAEVTVDIEKQLPIQGGLGAGSANAAAALLALERELHLDIPQATRLAIAAEVGSDVPLFLVGGTVLGSNRGETVSPVPDLTLAGLDEIPCVLALPRIGVSTPQAFRDWDRRLQTPPDLRNPPIRDTLGELSRIFASVLSIQPDVGWLKAADGQASQEPTSNLPPDQASKQDHPENLQEPREQHHASLKPQGTGGSHGRENDQAGNSLLTLIGTTGDRGASNGRGLIENDFETVVFPQSPLLREIKRVLQGTGEQQAVYAALSGSGSALFGLYRSSGDAEAAQQRLQQHGTQAFVTKTTPRHRYWSDMFAE